MTRSDDPDDTGRTTPNPRSSTGPDHAAPAAPSRAAPAAPPRVAEDHTGRDSLIGTDHGHRATNASWGAIFAGVVTFLAIMVVFGLITAGLGLTDATATTVGIWSVVAVLVALALGGFIAGALAVRSGLLHGLVTRAASSAGC